MGRLTPEQALELADRRRVQSEQTELRAKKAAVKQVMDSKDGIYVDKIWKFAMSVAKNQKTQGAKLQVVRRQMRFQARPGQPRKMQTRLKLRRHRRQR